MRDGGKEGRAPGPGAPGADWSYEYDGGFH